MEYAKVYDIWDCQGKNSFVKAKTDWFSAEKYASRLHFSFVKHSGRPTCKQEAAIEIAIPMIKTGSDGAGHDGNNALALASIINSGRLEKMCAASRAAAAQQGKQYADDIFCCIGGTPASRSKTGKPEFRQLSIAPAVRGDGYVIKASSCEGVQADTGAISPAQGAQRTIIMVPVSIMYMRALGQYIITEWTAYKTALVIGQMSFKPIAQSEAPDDDIIAPVIDEEEEVREPASQKEKDESVAEKDGNAGTQAAQMTSTEIWIISDDKNLCFETAKSAEEAVDKARKCLRTLKNHPDRCMCCFAEEGTKFANDIRSENLIDINETTKAVKPLALAFEETGGANALHVYKTTINS